MVERSRGGVSVCVYVCVGLSVCVCVRRDWGRERAKRGAARRGRMACGSEHPMMSWRERGAGPEIPNHAGMDGWRYARVSGMSREKTRHPLERWLAGTTRSHRVILLISLNTAAIPYTVLSGSNGPN